MCYCGMPNCDGPINETMETETEFRERMERESLFRFMSKRVAKRHKKTNFSVEEKYSLGLRHAKESGILLGVHPATYVPTPDSSTKPIRAGSDFRIRMEREEEDTAPVEASEGLVGVTLPNGEDDSDGITEEHIRQECRKIRMQA